MQVMNIHFLRILNLLFSMGLKMFLKIKHFFYSTTVLILLFSSTQTFADCNVSSNGVSFGNYDVFAVNHTDSAGTLTVNCSVETPPYTLKLAPGSSGNFSQRKMFKGGDYLAYNIYSDAARTLVWGDGTGKSVTKSGQAGATEQHTLYGRIPAKQNVFVGNYLDTIIVTIEW
ncbi:spore coat U domain-containing protein [Acinetobacter radioresistens]|uniref:Csu type fimbrial protein n=1 Tax=Acinetobacter radioresistens TaxID=40216 RepID=UPI0021D2A34A|nr:spore coat U domain-containing protein [Acinetobacter radioresistens]MCU4385545.1 spore coat U domain-containing protein [Acinetobacter radioresistens]